MAHASVHTRGTHFNWNWRTEREKEKQIWCTCIRMQCNQLLNQSNISLSCSNVSLALRSIHSSRLLIQKCCVAAEQNSTTQHTTIGDAVAVAVAIVVVVVKVTTNTNELHGIKITSRRFSFYWNKNTDARMCNCEETIQLLYEMHLLLGLDLYSYSPTPFPSFRCTYCSICIRKKNLISFCFGKRFYR